MRKPRWWTSASRATWTSHCAGRELLHARERVAPGALELVGVEQLREVRIGVDQADDVAPHGRVLPIEGMSER